MMRLCLAPWHRTRRSQDGKDEQTEEIKEKLMGGKSQKKQLRLLLAGRGWSLDPKRNQRGSVG